MWKCPRSMTLRPCFIILVPFPYVLSKHLFSHWTKMKINRPWENKRTFPWFHITLLLCLFSVPFTYKSVTRAPCTQYFHTHFSTHSNLASFSCVFQKCFPLFSTSGFIITNTMNIHSLGLHGLLCCFGHCWSLFTSGNYSLAFWVITNSSCSILSFLRFFLFCLACNCEFSPELCHWGLLFLILTVSP